jgi:hypothetical protein
VESPSRRCNGTTHAETVELKRARTNGQIGTEELSQNVAGLGPSNRKGRGKWQGRGTRMLALYSRHGDSAAVRRFCGAVEE